jgi:hypothetical protein
MLYDIFLCVGLNMFLLKRNFPIDMYSNYAKKINKYREN